MEQWPVLASHVSPLNLMTDFQFLNFLAIFLQEHDMKYSKSHAL